MNIPRWWTVAHSSFSSPPWIIAVVAIDTLHTCFGSASMAEWCIGTTASPTLSWLVLNSITTPWGTRKSAPNKQLCDTSSAINTWPLLVRQACLVGLWLKIYIAMESFENHVQLRHTLRLCCCFHHRHLPLSPGFCIPQNQVALEICRPSGEWKEMLVEFPSKRSDLLLHMYLSLRFADVHT